MKQIIQKYLSIFLSAIMTITCLPVGSFAQKATSGPLYHVQMADPSSKLRAQVEFVMSNTNPGKMNIVEQKRILQKRIEALYRSTRDLSRYSKAQARELQNILEDYEKFLINLQDATEAFKELEKSKNSFFDLLIQAYSDVSNNTSDVVADYYQKRIINLTGDPINKPIKIRIKKETMSKNKSYFIRYPYKTDFYFIPPTSNYNIIWNEQNKLIVETIINESPNDFLIKDFNPDIESIITRLYYADFEQNADIFEKLYRKFEKEAVKCLDFSNEKNTEDFFKKLLAQVTKKIEENQALSEELAKKMGKNPPHTSAGNNLLREFVRIENKDLHTITTRLNILYSKISQEATKKLSKNTLAKMIDFLSVLNPQQFAEFMATNKQISPAQEKLIGMIRDFADKPNFNIVPTQFGKSSAEANLYIDLYEDVLTTMFEESDKTTKVVKKAPKTTKIGTRAARSIAGLTGIITVLGSLYILDKIVQVDANGNSFANSLNPANTKAKIKNGTATNTEKYAYYMLPCSVEYMEEDPVQFASVLLPAIEGLTNPLYDEIMESYIMQIK